MTYPAVIVMSHEWDMADKHSLGVTGLHQTQPQTERTQWLLHALVQTNQQKGIHLTNQE
jgi:hypothetical protein